MPARPLSDTTLHLIDAVRTALAHRSDVDERPLFGTHAFFVDGKVCLAVRNDELLVRLPPERHSELLEMQNTRELSPGGGMKGYFWVEPNGYATRAQWRFWVDEALAYNPRAKATPPRSSRKPRASVGSQAVKTATRETPAPGANAATKAAAISRTGASTKPKAKPQAKAEAPPTQALPAKALPARKHSIFEADD